MKSIDEIRTENLRFVATEQGGTGRLASVISRSSSQVSQWLSRSTNFGTGKARVISAESCRLVESKCGKPIGWMDVDHTASSLLAITTAEEVYKLYCALASAEKERFLALLANL